MPTDPSTSAATTNPTCVEWLVPPITTGGSLRLDQIASAATCCPACGNRAEYENSVVETQHEHAVMAEPMTVGKPRWER